MSILGVAEATEMRIGQWKGKVDITVVPMDDYSLVLDMEFLDTVKAFLVPYANIMSLNQDGVPYMVSIQRKSKPTKVIYHLCSCTMRCSLKSLCPR